MHLFVLGAFAFAQPLFEVLRSNATFFVARRSEPIDICVLALVLVVLIPAAAFALEDIAGASRRHVTHLAFVVGLVTLIALPPLKRLGGDESSWPLLAAPASGALSGLVYARWKAARLFLTVLAPAPILFTARFFSDPSISSFLSPQSYEVLGPLDTDADVVFLVLDELPLSSLVNTDLEIESELFPNFARLAENATWFRNATASHSHTDSVVPALLTGRAPSDQDLLPVLENHPRNLFTLFAGSHRMIARESITALCPEELLDEGATQTHDFLARMVLLADDLSIVYAHIVFPGPITSSLPPVADNWGGFRPAVQRELDRAVDRGTYFRRFTETVQDGPRPGLFYLHVLLPHRPWNTLPTGRRFLTADQFEWPTWPAIERPTALAMQQHLLQLGYVDRLLGELLDRLEETGMYDRALIALMGDHGISFLPGQPPRGRVTQNNKRDIMHVPLLIKAPHQRRAIVTDRNVQSEDLLPTIADALGIELPWEVDGVSGFDESIPARPTKTIIDKLTGRVFEADGRFPTVWEAIERKVRYFGRHPSWDAVYAMGPRPELLGRRVRELNPGPPFSGHAYVKDLEFYQRVVPAEGILPSFVRGRVTPSDGFEPPSGVAVVLNGVVRATTATWTRGGSTAYFGVMVPEESLRAGRNEIAVYALGENGELAVIPDVTSCPGGTRGSRGAQAGDG